MKLMAVTLLAAGLLAAGGHGDRASLSYSIGAGVMTPWIFSQDTQAGTGFGGMFGVETPMYQGNQFSLKAGFFTAGTDNGGYGSVAFVPLTLSYRKYPFYRSYAGPRGIEPLLGVHAGGVLAWDSPEGDMEGTTTGGGMLGAELGARISLGWTSFFEIAGSVDYIPLGSSIAGEEKGCSAVTLMASVVF